MPSYTKTGKPLPDKEAQRRIAVLDRHGWNISTAAPELGIARTTLQGFVKRHRQTEEPVQALEDVGYDLTPREYTPQEAWDEHAKVAERTISGAVQKRWSVVKRPRGAFCIFHSTDEHIDDNATPLRLIEADIEASHALGAVMCHGGDLLNNWPVGGKLAKQWAEQSCPLPASLLRAQHFIRLFKPEVWTDGNHEEMNPYLMSMLDSWLPKTCLRDYWTVSFEVHTPGGREVRVSMSHKFQKGSSYFHPHHGVLREMLEGEDVDVYMEGHLHVSGWMYRTLPERGHSVTAVSSAGYKVLDKYAARISRGGKIVKLKGRAHWIVCDPQAEGGEQLSTVFDSPRQAEAMLNGLQNLRAV